MTRVLTCSDVIAAFGDDVPHCCDSCHDDFDDGRDYVCELEIGDIRFDTCCSVNRWLQENPARLAHFNPSVESTNT